MPQWSPLHTRGGGDDGIKDGDPLNSFEISPPSSIGSSNASGWQSSGPTPALPERSPSTAPKPAQPIAEHQSVQDQAPTLNRLSTDNEGPDRPPPPPYEGPSPSGLPSAERGPASSHRPEQSIKGATARVPSHSSFVPSQARTTFGRTPIQSASPSTVSKGTPARRRSPAAPNTSGKNGAGSGNPAATRSRTFTPKNASSSVEGRSGEGSGTVRSKTSTPTNQGGNYGAGATASSELSPTPPVQKATTRIQTSPPVASKPTSAQSAESPTQRRGVTQDPANSGMGQTPPAAPAPPVSTKRDAPTGDALARRLLEVTVIEAAGLLGTDKGGVSNPRVDVLLVDLAGRVVRMEGVKQTSVKMGTVRPVWNHKVVFGHRANLSSASNNLPTLRLQVYSYQRFSAEKPLGQVDIPLVNLSSDGEEWQHWYSLEPFGRLRAGGRLGSLHVKISIGAVVDSRSGSSRHFTDVGRGIAAAGDEEEGYEEQPPNFLRITLHQAQELIAKDLDTGSSDPFAIMKVAGQEKRSRTITRNLNPTWEETFDFRVSSSGDTLEITLEDEDKFVNDFLGFVSILMGDMADKRKVRQWFDLKRKTGDLAPGEERGAIDITTQWFFNPNISPDVKKKKRKKQGWALTGQKDDSDTEEEDEDPANDPNAQLAEEMNPEEKKERDAEDQARLNKLQDFKVVTGDYVAYVHIIEVRDLKAEDVQGTSDPVVYVEAFGQKFATEVVYNRLSAVFDETFVINLRNMDVDEFKEGVFRVSVMDADGSIGSLGSLKTDLIGTVSFDATYIYFHENHEIHRRWVALVNDQNPGKVSIQGYLHLSIVIVGPGDRLKVHDEEADRRNERKAEMNAGGLDALVVMPPSLELKTKWLVSTIAKAEYLPVMDSNLVGGAGGGDFFVQAAVAGGKPIRTRKITIMGERHRLNPEWRTELWQPVTLPCMSGNIKYSIWDWDAVGANEMVGVFYSKVNDVETRMLKEGRPKSRWVNIYGPPLYVPETRGFKELTKKAATLGYTDSVDYLLQYQNFPQHASTYRGRVMVVERIADSLPGKREKNSAWRRKVRMPPVPPSIPYTLRVFVGAGTEIPRFTDVTNFGNAKKMWLRFSIGRYEVSTTPVDNKNGVCEWYQSLQLKSNFNLPEDPDQVPDLIVYLMVGTGANAQPCSFRRFSGKDLIDEAFGGKPEWFRLGEDRVLDLLEEFEFPGSVLVRVGLGTVQAYGENRDKWKDEIQGLLRREPYELRVHVYQARNLPAADSNGLMDPYLKIKFKGEETRTEIRKETVDPIWYRTVQIKASLPPKEYQAYFPQVTVQLFDWDLKWTDDYCGNLFIGLGDIEIIQADRRTTSLPPPPKPKWEPFYMEQPGDGQGELLVSVQLINTKSTDLPEPENITPKTRAAWLDMVILGIRDMRPYQYLPMQLPFCVFEVDDMDGTKKPANTETSNKPTGRDANFLQHIKMQLQLPEDEIYSPRVKIRVYDTRLGGFIVPLVGAGRIGLEKKLPWGSDYVPPLASTFAKESLLRAIMADDGDELEKDPEAPPNYDDYVNNSSSFDSGGVSARSRRNNRSSRGGVGLQLSSFGDSDEEGEPGLPGKRGTSGFIRTGGVGGLPRPAVTPRGSDGRTSNGVFNNARSSTPPGGMGGGAAGAMEVVREQSWSGSIDNSTHLNASGHMVDTGIGAMAALDVAREQQQHHHHQQQAESVGQGAMMIGDDRKGSVGTEEEKQQQQNEQVPAPGTIAASVEDLWADDLNVTETPKYLVGREELDHGLEEEFKSTPFETYDLMRGQTLGLSGGGAGSLKVVGKLKCIVRVTEGDPDDEPLFVDKNNFESLDKAKDRNNKILGELLKPRGYKVRLYVLQALNLTPMDLGIGGRPGKSDPYLKVKLGKELFDDNKNFIQDVTDADIYKCVELNCELPGAGQLQVDIMDRDDIGRDELIGRTTFDLEDRWFDTRWQAWGLPNRSEDMSGMRFQTKPLETRTLKVPTSLAPQGQLRCWLDIMSPEDSRAFPPDDVSLSPALDFEVRVVFWKCKDVVAMDTILDQNDLFVRSWLEGCDHQETDTHWFAKKGKGSFNWRLKFKVSLGPRTRTWKFPYLTVQLWDRDLFKWNDHIAEGQLDLGPYFRKAYRLRETVKLFQKMDPKLEQKREEAKAELDNMEIDARRLDNPATDRLIAADIESGPAEFDPVLHGRAPPPPRHAQTPVEAAAAAVAAVSAAAAPGQPNEENPTPARPRPAIASGGARTKSAEPKKKRKRGCCYWFCRCCCPCPRLDHDGSAQVGPGDEGDDEDKADAKALINQIKNLTGLWDSDPEESYWLKMERTNYETGQKEQMGKCLLGVQICPIEKAEQQPAGIGRNDPNNNPFLPPPTGRLRFSLNPFIMGTELFGAKVCCRIACVCCCVIVIVVAVYFSSFFNFLWSVGTTLFGS